MFVTNLNPIMKKVFLALSFGLCATLAMAQYRNKDGNRIGITGGVSQTSLLNSNFVTTPGIGFNGGLSVRGNYYNNWSMIYGMQFFQNTFSIETTTSSLQKKESEFNIQGAQIRLLLSYNVVKNHVSFDFGPVLQINDKLKTANSDQNNTITGTNLKAVQLEEISKINGNVYVGISAGTRRVRAIVYYQYGFTNVLNKLNSEEALVLLNNNTKFKGTLGTISGQILFNL
jgi:Outer membrane protein beta-barrel domain